MRGALDVIASYDERLRIIPAYAGSTFPCLRQIRVCRDHPRVCGEHLDVQQWLDGLSGSSPRMRGAPAPHISFQRRGRDHPRVCGEHCVASVYVNDIEGIIPAYAGSTSAWR